MKVIAVLNELPILAASQPEESIELSKGLEQTLLNTALKNKTSTINPMLERFNISSTKKCIPELIHKQLQEDFTRDLKNVIFLGTIPNLIQIVGVEGEQSIISKLEEKYLNHGFYPISKKGIEDSGYKSFCDIRLKNICFSTQWNDIIVSVNEERSFEDYKKVNQVFYQGIASIYEKGDVIWILDHSLWLLPEIIRREIPDAKIGTSIFLPFPGSDLFDCISCSEELIISLLSSSYIEFQSKASLDNFLGFCKLMHSDFSFNKCRKSLVFQGKTVKYAVNRCKVGFSMPKKVLISDRCRAYIRALKRKYKGKRVIASITNVTSSHALLNVYKAMEYFFENYSRNVVFINIEIVDGSYDPDVKAEVGRIEEHIRLKYGEGLFKRKLGLKDYKYYGLLSIADCGLALMENCDFFLPAADFTYLHSHKKLVKGTPLIVASSSTFRKEKNTIKLNPHDFSLVATKVAEVLKVLTKEDAGKGHKVHASRRLHQKNAWFTKFMKNIENVQGSVEKAIPSGDLSTVLEKYRKASKRALLLDYDGTLAAIVQNPDDAHPSADLLSLLRDLKKTNRVIIVTGRDKKTIDSWVKDPEIEICAEHGTFYRKGGVWQGCEVDSGWMEPAKNIINFYIERSQGSSLEIKDTALCFHYRRCSKFIQKKQAKACRNSLYLFFKDFKNLEISVGKCVVEIRVAGKNKGDIVKEICSDYEFILCAGDDVTDESMFNIASEKENCFSILVGKRKTYANFSVDSVAAMMDFLKTLSNIQ